MHDSAVWLAESIIDRAEALLLDFRNANGSSGLLLDPVPTKWIAPPLDIYKVNFEMSWTKELNIVGLG